MKPLTGIKWIKRNSYFWFEDEIETAVIRGWVERIEDRTWKIELNCAQCSIYINAYYEKKKDAIAAIPQLLRALPDEWQAAIGKLTWPCSYTSGTSSGATSHTSTDTTEAARACHAQPSATRKGGDSICNSKY